MLSAGRFLCSKLDGLANVFITDRDCFKEASRTGRVREPKVPPPVSQCFRDRRSALPVPPRPHSCDADRPAPPTPPASIPAPRARRVKPFRRGIWSKVSALPHAWRMTTMSLHIMSVIFSRTRALGIPGYEESIINIRSTRFSHPQGYAKVGSASRGIFP